ncbi:conserved hypothetical protein [Arthrobacter sp. 9AX]|nr:conserved hypothetical protein [Arthrobacter sp. 9AX]
MHVGAADPPIGAEFAQCLAVVAGCVGGEANSFTDSGQPATAAAGGEGVLEGQFRLVVDQAAGHHQVAGDPLGAVGLQSLDLVLRGAVQLLARYIVVDLGGPFPVRAVGAAEVAYVGYAGRAFFLAVAAEGAGAGVAAVTTARAAIEAAGCAAVFLSVAPVGPLAAVAKRLAVLSATKPAAVTFAVSARTIIKGTVLAVTKGLTVAVAKRLAVLSATKPAAVTLAVAARTIIEGTVLAVTKRLTLTATKPAAVTLAVAARTITKRLTLTATKPAAVTLAVAARTITKRLLVAVTERLALSAAGCPLGGIAVVAARPGPESTGFAAGVVVSAEPAAVIPAAVAAVVLSHVDSSCCEPTTGADCSRSYPCFVFLRNPKSSASKSVHLHQF